MEENISIEFTTPELFFVKNISQICRICLLETKGTPLVEAMFKDKRVFDILSEHLVIEVLDDDLLPQNICNRCRQEVVNMCTLIEKCQKAHVFLQSYLKFALKKEQLEIYDVLVKEEVITDSRNSEQNKADVVLDMELQDKIEVDCVKSSENNGNEIVNRWHNEVEFSLGNAITEEEGKEVCKSQCPTCLKYFTSSRLNRHMKVHTDSIRTHQCPTCLKHFSKEDLEQHMRVHAEEKLFECQVCFKIFKIKANLKRHMMVHTGERPHICEICGKAFGQLVVLAAHKKTHVSYEHFDPKTGVPSFTCSHCGRTFKRSGHFNLHVKKHEKNENKPIKNENKTSTEENEKLHNCTICKKNYKSKASLYTHRLQHREKSFLCNECGKPFVTKASLKEHLTLHTGEKPYSCKFCHKSFARIVNLESHLLIHTGVKPHTCNICGNCFTQATHLKYHMLTHTGERAYECNYCGKRFALKGNLTVHVRTHTKETPYKCPVCYKGYYDSSSMKKHKKCHE